MTSIYIMCIWSSWMISIILFTFLGLNRVFKNYEIKVFIKSDKANKYLGVNLVSYIIRNSPLRYLNPGVYLKKISVKELRRVETEIKNAERGHLFAFILVFIVSLYFLLFKNSGRDYFYLMLWNIVFNLYPVFALQLQKRKIYTILKKEIV